MRHCLLRFFLLHSNTIPNIHGVSESYWLFCVNCYLALLPNSLTTSNNLFDALGFSMCHAQIITICVFFLLSFICFFFPSLITLSMTFRTVLNSINIVLIQRYLCTYPVQDKGILILFLTFIGLHLMFHQT